MAQIKSSPKIVELVGLAGAGKSTTAKALEQCSDEVQVVDPPYFRKLGDIPFFVWNTRLLLPTLFRLSFNKRGSSRPLTEREMVWMTILLGWHHRLKRSVLNSSHVIVLDQGPVFMLMELYLFGPEALKSPSSQEWWCKTCKQWAAALDRVIWLDAPNTTLVARIRARGVWHGVKEKSDAEAFEYLARYREAYKHVISILTSSNDDLKVLGFDTAQESLKRVVNSLCLEFGVKENGA